MGNGRNGNGGSRGNGIIESGGSRGNEELRVEVGVEMAKELLVMEVVTESVE